jgi:hypothetical protein
MRHSERVHKGVEISISIIRSKSSEETDCEGVGVELEYVEIKVHGMVRH